MEKLEITVDSLEEGLAEVAQWKKHNPKTFFKGLHFIHQVSSDESEYFTVLLFFEPY